MVYEHGVRFSTHAEINVSTDVRFRDYQQGLKEQKQMKNVDWLAICCFVVNKRCESVIKMNNKWFADNLLYSPNDQVSFPTACEYADVNVKLYKFTKPYNGKRYRKWLRSRRSRKSHMETEHYIKHNHLVSYMEYVGGK